MGTRLITRWIAPTVLGFVIAAMAVAGYFFLLQLLISPYMKGLDHTLEQIAEKQKARVEMGLEKPRIEREAILDQRFGVLPSENDVNIQKRVALGWHKFCVLAFAVIALVTLIHYVWRKDQAKAWYLHRHLLALPAFAFALPLLFFSPPAQRIIKPFSAIFSILFFASLIVAAIIEKKKAGKS